MRAMNRMVSIDLNTPSPSLTGCFHQTDYAGGGDISFTKSSKYNQPGKFHLKSVDSTETNIYYKYFHRKIAKLVSLVQLTFAVVILVSQLCTTGLLIGPVNSLPNVSALSTSERIGVGIWASVLTTLAAGSTYWAINKLNFFRLHSSMLINLFAFIGYTILEYLMLMNTIPKIQERIYFLQPAEINESPLDARRQLYHSNSNQKEEIKLKIDFQAKTQAELHRLYAALGLSILMALFGIFQILLHGFISLKSGRAICLGKTYFEGRLFQMQTIGRCWRNKSFRMEKNQRFPEIPKLERSDALPPPPYESGYFHPSLTV